MMLLAMDGNHLSDHQFLPFYSTHKLFQSGNLVIEYFCRFESRNIVSRDNECGVLADVARSLLGTGLDDKRTEAAEINVFSVCEASLNNCHKLFDNGNDLSLIHI